MGKLRPSMSFAGLQFPSPLATVLRWLRPTLGPSYTAEVEGASMRRHDHLLLLPSILRARAHGPPLTRQRSLHARGQNYRS